MEQLVVCKTAHRQLCALTGVGEGKEGAVHAQRQHAVDVQDSLTELGAEHDGVHALSLQLLQVAQQALPQHTGHRQWRSRRPLPR